VTFENIASVSAQSQRTVVNMIGGYSPNTPLELRQSYLKKVERYADVAIHVDPMSTEYFIDKAINPKIDYRFISQGLDFKELTPYRNLVGKSKDPYFLYAHNLWGWKRPDLFVEDLAALTPDLKFEVIASDKTGDRIEQTQKSVAKYKNASIHLGLSRSDFLKKIAGATAIVSTSRVEGAQPNIMLEAGFIGVPYLSLCPGQNFAHYPHVEMFYALEDLRNRLIASYKNLLKEKATDLERAKKFMSSSRFDWDAIIKEYRGVLG